MHIHFPLRFLSVVILLLGFVACAEQGQPEVDEMSALLTEAKANPTKESLNSYFDKVTSFIQVHKDDSALINPVMQEAANFAGAQNQHSKAISYLIPLLRNSTTDCKVDPNQVLSLAQSMNSLNKKHAAKVIYKNYKSQYENAPEDQALETLMTDEVASLQAYVDTTFQAVFADPDQYGLNRAAALKYVDVVEAYALSAPCDKASPEYLYKASEIARSIRTLPKALSIYDWILEDYPEYEKTPTVFFLKGFILENDVKDEEAARNIYNEFLEKYPQHEMADDVKFLLENMGRSDEEILKFLEKKREGDEKQ